MNEVVRIENHEISPWQVYADETLASAIAGDLLKFVKGEWLRGDSKEPVPEDAMFVTNMDELWTGWVRWSDNSPVEHRISRLKDGAPKLLREDLGHLDKACWETNPDGTLRDPWAQTDRLVMRDDCTDELVTFVTGSYGGRWALARLCRAYDREVFKQEGRLPVVSLAVDKWRHEKFGTIPRPLFKIVGWSYWDRDAQPPAAPKLEKELNDRIPF